MTPEAAAYLDKARSDLDDAKEIEAIQLAQVAARSAYYAAFHAAEAFILNAPAQSPRPTRVYVRSLLVY